MISILLDTSYLITLADPGRAHHETAKRYLREALAQGCPLYLSAVVASEFQVGQPIRDGLHNSLRSVIARRRAVRCVAFLANSRAIGCEKAPCGPSRSALPPTREGYAGHPY